MKGMIKHECGDKKLSVSQNSCGRDMRRYRPPYSEIFQGEIDKAIRSHNPLTLILDYSQVTFMDSSGIGLVMGRYRIMSEMGGEVIVASPPAYIRKVLQLAGMHRLTKIVTDIAPYIQEKKAAQEQNESPDDKTKESDKIETKTP